MHSAQKDANMATIHHNGSAVKLQHRTPALVNHINRARLRDRASWRNIARIQQIVWIYVINIFRYKVRARAQSKPTKTRIRTCNTRHIGFYEHCAPRISQAWFAVIRIARVLAHVIHLWPSSHWTYISMIIWLCFIIIFVDESTRAQAPESINMHSAPSSVGAASNHAIIGAYIYAVRDGWWWVRCMPCAADTRRASKRLWNSIKKSLSRLYSAVRLGGAHQLLWCPNTHGRCAVYHYYCI